MHTKNRIKHILCYVFGIFFLRAAASLQTTIDEDGTEWVMILKTVDGVVIESDPESAGQLPSIEQSYYQSDTEDLKKKYKDPLVYSIIETQEYTIKKFVKDDDLTDRIIEKYANNSLCLQSMTEKTKKE